MRVPTVIAALAGSAAAAPFSFPLPNGFPSPNTAALSMIEELAGGPLPNTALPTSVSPQVVTALQLIAANEIFEVAYFTELHNNITSGVAGYELAGMNKTYVSGVINAIANQEQLHALGANAILKNVGAPTVSPCQYAFPVSDFMSAVVLANTFTDVVLGLLPAVQETAATEGGKQGAALIPLVGSIIGQEAEQVGWYRSLQDLVPSAAPFLSPSTPQFALSAIKMFLVPGSCPATYSALEKIVPSFSPLMVTSPPTASTMTVGYEISGTINPATDGIVYISGQNAPFYVGIGNMTTSGGMTSFTAPFPYDMGFANGLTTAALVKTRKAFASASEVAMYTAYGPGLIEFM